MNMDEHLFYQKQIDTSRFVDYIESAFAFVERFVTTLHVRIQYGDQGTTERYSVQIVFQRTVRI